MIDVAIEKRYCPHCRRFYKVSNLNQTCCPRCGKKSPHLGTVRNSKGEIVRKE